MMRNYSLRKNLLWALVFVLFGSATAVAGTYGGGTGTMEDPYLISNKTDLLELDTTTLDWGANLYFKVTDSIDMEGETFHPIGYGSKVFSGTLEGDTNVISNLTITPWDGMGDNDGLGLFGSMSGDIKNLVLSNVNFDYKGNRAAAFVGQLSAGTIENCALLGGSLKAGGWLGSFVGVSWGTPTVKNCFSTAKVTAGWGHAGIFGMGQEASIVTNCAFYGTTNGEAISRKNSVVTDCIYLNGGGDKGTKLTPAQAMDQANYTNFDFTDIWVMNPEPEGYAVLKAFAAEVFADVVMQHYSGGKGTADAPWEIASKADILKLDTMQAHWAGNHYFKVTADIDMGNDSIMPIGYGAKVFTANFDGNNHVIKNIAIKPWADQGANDGFGFIGNMSGNVSNLILENVNFDYGGNRAAGFVGVLNDGSITNCALLGGRIKAGGWLGSFVGVSWGAPSVTNCLSTAEVVAGWGKSGIYGDAKAAATVTNCAFFGTINGGNAISGGSAVITDCVYLSTAGGAGDGTSLIPDDATVQANYVNFDFDNVWVMKAQSYAILKSFPEALFENMPSVKIVADAGAPQVVNKGDSVMLDGSASLGDPITFHWITAEGITLTDTAIVNPKFKAPEDITADTDYKFGLVIRKGESADTAWVTVTVKGLTITDRALDKSMWGFVSATSIRDGQDPTLAFNDNLGAQFFSDWEGGFSFPLEFVYDMGAEAMVSAFRYVGRQDEWGPNGCITDYEIQVSLDGTNWTSAAVGTWTYPPKGDDNSYYKGEKDAVFAAPVMARYFKLIANEDLGEASAQVGIAELTMFGYYKLNNDNWKFESATSIREGQTPETAFDNDLVNNTVYSDWQDATLDFPFEFVIDLGRDAYVDGLTYVPRQVWGPNGTITDYEIYVSSDLDNWGDAAKVGTFSYPMVEGVADYTVAQTATFDATVKGRYFKFVGKADLGDSKQMGITELIVYGMYDPEAEWDKMDPIVVVPTDSIEISRDGMRIEDNGTGNFGYTTTNSFAKFAVDIPYDGYYIVKHSMSTNRDGAKVKLSVDGVVIDTTDVDKKGWTSYNDFVTDTFMLSAKDSTIFMIEVVDDGWNWENMTIYAYAPLNSVTMPDLVVLEATEEKQIEWEQDHPNSEILISSFTSLDASIATVTDAGVVTGVAQGEAKVVWSLSDGINTYSDTIQRVVVKKKSYPVTGVSVTPEKLSMERGSTGMVTAEIFPATADNPNVVWRSSNPTVASVDSDGKVTGGKPGEALVYVITEDGLFKDTCVVTVTQILVKGITVRPKEVELQMGAKETERLWFTFTPSNAADRTYTIKSLNEDVVTISGDLVVAAAKGMAKVVVTSNDGGFTDTCQVTVLSGASINNAETASMKVYPNPASGKNVVVSLPGNQSAATISIFDIQGKMINQQIMKGESATIEISTMTSGLYFVKIDSSLGSFVEKLTVK